MQLHQCPLEKFLMLKHTVHGVIECSQIKKVWLTLCGTPVQSTHKQLPEKSRYITIKSVIDYFFESDYIINSITCINRSNIQKDMLTEMKEFCQTKCLKNNYKYKRLGGEDWKHSFRGITRLQLTKQPSTQILHNMRQRSYQSCCSLERYTRSSS